MGLPSVLGAHKGRKDVPQYGVTRGGGGTGCCATGRKASQSVLRARGARLEEPGWNKPPCRMVRCRLTKEKLTNKKKVQCRIAMKRIELGVWKVTRTTPPALGRTILNSSRKGREQVAEKPMSRRRRREATKGGRRGKKKQKRKTSPVLDRGRGMRFPRGDNGAGGRWKSG